MGKRSSFERVERDYYPTPLEAVRPLLHHLEPGTRFVEPCAGDGALIDHLTDAGHVCWDSSDIDPRREDISERNALINQFYLAPCFITNPPWDRKILHPLIVHLSDQAPTWLLFDADWIHTVQAIPFMPRLKRIVAVGRIKWIPNSPFTGKDNCAWHLFGRPSAIPAQFYGRVAA